jgi:hypothetical protein
LKTNNRSAPECVAFYLAIILLKFIAPTQGALVIQKMSQLV